ncbi:hypothetical protein HHI36_003918 [Cryptolaemus montrouzieri]|uniref:Ribosome biogenesis protein NOP53 n=1 Tax=Cryptolaemus montrouzieri TaxID=559131 RepID=A0ABD2NPN7_9CUCU
MSYNPSFEDHQDLLKNISEKEQKLIKRDQHLNRVTKHIRRKVAQNTAQNAWLEEMSQGLPIMNQKDSSMKEEVSDNTLEEYQSINPPVINKKKSLKQRRKQKERLLEEKLKKLAKVEKKKVSDLHRLKVLKEQVNLVDKKVLLNKQKRKNIMK